MPNHCSRDDVQPRRNRAADLHDAMLLALAVLAVIHCRPAAAGENGPVAVLPGPALTAPLRIPSSVDILTAPRTDWVPLSAWYAPVAAPEAAPVWSREFRPHGPSISSAAVRPKPLDEPSFVRGTIWQRLADFRAHNRVRLLTLWQGRGTSLSLQAGRRGDPSLQWTSGFTARSVAAPALFDELFATGFGGSPLRDTHPAQHVPIASPGGKSNKPPELGLAGIGGK